jgi:hypothetical protein
MSSPLNHTCNLYCQNGVHAILVLAFPVDSFGNEISRNAVIDGGSAYFHYNGYNIVDAKPALEADGPDVIKHLVYPVLIEGESTKEYPVPPDYKNYKPWLLFLRSF